MDVSAVKPVNTGGLANEFHVWQRGRLRGCVIQDLDAWAITVADRSYAPLALFELKRSSTDPVEWWPYPDDRRNYASLLALAQRAEIPLYVVYWRKGSAITDSTRLHIFSMTEAVPDYHGVHMVMTGREFARRFPFPFGRPVMS